MKVIASLFKLDKGIYLAFASTSLLHCYSCGTHGDQIVCQTQNRAVLVRVLVGNIALCSKARHLTLAVPLSCLGGVVPHL